MKLKVKSLDWDAGIPISMIDDETAKKMDIRTNDRINIKIDHKELVTVVDIVGDLIKKDEIAVSNEIFKRLKLKKGQEVDINLAMPPNSTGFVKKKLDGESLKKNEIEEILEDIVLNSLSESEIALFVAGMYKNGMTFKETTYLIDGILKTGNKLKLNKKLIVDKHSIGGVPGKITPIVVSICVAAGLTMPKTSSRAITSSAGTADSIETVAEVDFSTEELEKIVKKVGGCFVWGGGLEMVPADSKIIQVEKKLNLDPEAQLLASIMSKKLAAGSNYIVLHFPYGKYAKVSKEKAEKLKSKFERLGKHFDKEIKCVLSHNKGPYGEGVGPILEMIDAIKVLDPDKKGPRKLEKESIKLAGELLEMTKRANKSEGKKLANELLSSGKAFEKFKEIVKAQRGKIKDLDNLKPAPVKKTIYSKRSFKIKEIDNNSINSTARFAGCPSDKDAGLYLYFHEGEKVKKGDKLITIYSESKSRLKQAEDYFNKNFSFKEE